ncbi:MAG: ABC transporter permease, partial [Phycisphaerae bacterium]|nr:ABC transporter permease [Phycisphaerae bacterium]
MPEKDYELSGPAGWISQLGRGLIDAAVFVGGMSILLGQTLSWSLRSLVGRKGKSARARVFKQMVRVGVRSIPIVLLIQFSIGFILALQMAPELDRWGQVEQVASINAVAGFRELGPLMAGIVLAG